MLDLSNTEFPVIGSKRQLLDNLTFVYSVIVASEDLLLFAAARCENVPDAMPWQPYFLRKLGQETSHAEWLLEDILKLGGEKPPLDYSAASVAGSQFFMIKYSDPRLLLGYMAALERNPMPLTEVDRLESQYGSLPTLRYHAEHDLEHGQDVIGEIAQIDDKDLRLKIAYNERCTRAQIANVLRGRFEALPAAVMH